MNIERSLSIRFTVLLIIYQYFKIMIGIMIQLTRHPFFGGRGKINL